MTPNFFKKHVVFCILIFLSFLLGIACFSMVNSFLNGSWVDYFVSEDIDWTLIVSSASALATATAAIYTAKAAKAAEMSATQWRHQAVYDKYLDKAINSRASLTTIKHQLEKIEDGAYEVFDDKDIESDDDDSKRIAMTSWAEVMAKETLAIFDVHLDNVTQDLNHAYALSREYINENKVESVQLEITINALTRGLKLYREYSLDVIECSLKDEHYSNSMNKFLLDDTVDYAFLQNIILSITLVNDFLTHKIIHPNEDSWASSCELLTNYIKKNLALLDY
ncbi:hypothetical protein BZJ17_14990 [Salinivibrio sp. IB574]|uniref:hypothetical protein n=1 Tax=Salinivibrio sp. IB574 TaxID=1909444 RepID=UPI000989929D|nr:hypothetical protein [Salinivibrio sp. IB574]OOF19699.1 hypothetical protein BZJ17_14990 [Salinivibrio sp. IB574]